MRWFSRKSRTWYEDLRPSSVEVPGPPVGSEYSSPNVSVTRLQASATSITSSLRMLRRLAAPIKPMMIAGDLNGHVGVTKDGYSCHGGFGYESRNADGERNLVYAESHNLTIVNTVYRKHDSHFISFYSGSTRTQIDFVLVKDRDRNLVTDAKVVPYRPTTSTADMCFEDRPSEAEARRAMRSVKDQVVVSEKKEAAVTLRIRLPTVTTVDETWKNATDAILSASRSELGTTKPGQRKFRSAEFETRSTENRVGGIFPRLVDGRERRQPNARGHSCFLFFQTPPLDP
ncbi:unnamed protein product [Heligmosomoides polygyrus]|uniref:Endo/exonuclease/phosphatase domain-containing protein n=1 Tax=Heligmosomoides polygyrus TaxID=6339 RepID=A0A183FPS1_HELPZ|nr:unnamed protein product [Heligmosomoides polygyrus]